MRRAVITVLMGASSIATASSVDKCQPHGETNIMDPQQRCWGGGGDSPCFSCFFGDNCETFNTSSSCLVDASRNSFLLWQQYFEPSSSFPMTPPIPSSWAMPYQSADQGGIIPPLDGTIRRLHTMVGNVDPDGQRLLLCTGARGCALAVLYGINKVYGPGSDGLQAFSRAPYFALNPLWPALAHTGAATDAVWNASADPAASTSVEILTHPNNPDGAPLVPSVTNKSLVVCDQVYHWPWNHYAVTDLKCDISVFSMSKATGHCATRVGWAVIRDPRVFAAATSYTKFTAGGVSAEAQARSLAVLQHVVENNGTFFEAGRAILESRWDALDMALRSCLKSGVLLDYNKQHRGPLLWITAPVNKDGLAMLAVAGILGEDAMNFGGSSNQARVNLCVSSSSWDLVLARLRDVCNSQPEAVWAAADRLDAGELRERVALSGFTA